MAKFPRDRGIMEKMISELGGYQDTLQGKGYEGDVKKFMSLPNIGKMQYLLDNWDKVEKNPGLLEAVKEIAYNIFSQEDGPYRDVLSWINIPKESGPYTGTRTDDTEENLINDFWPQYKGYNYSIWKNRNMHKNYIWQDKTGFPEVPKQVGDSILIPTKENKAEYPYFYMRTLPKSGDSIDYSKLQRFYREELINTNRQKRGQSMLYGKALDDRVDEALRNVGAPPNSVIYPTNVGSGLFPVHVIDDATGVTTRTRRDANGNLVFDVTDLWNFAPNYEKLWSMPILKSVMEKQRRLAEKVGKPFYLLGSWPVKGEPKR